MNVSQTRFSFKKNIIHDLHFHRKTKNYGKIEAITKLSETRIVIREKGTSLESQRADSVSKKMNVWRQI